MSKRTKYLLLACLVPVFILLGMTVKPYTRFTMEKKSFYKQSLLTHLTHFVETMYH